MMSGRKNAENRKNTENTPENNTNNEFAKILSDSYASKEKTDDWREMSDEQWDKLIENVDEYIDDVKEDLKYREEKQREADMKAEKYSYTAENADKKVWTITSFSQDGIICNQCTIGGETKELWRIDYRSAGDAERVWNYLDKFEKNAKLNFAGSKEFWEKFLAGNISDDDVIMLGVSDGVKEYIYR